MPSQSKKYKVTEKSDDNHREDIMKLKWNTKIINMDEIRVSEINPRKWERKQIKEMNDSIEQFGYTRLIMLDFDNVIVAGNLCFYTLKNIRNQSGKIEVRYPNRKLTEAEFKKYMVIDNKMAENKWDYDILKDSFSESDLKEWGFAQDVIGGKVQEDIGKLSEYERKIKEKNLKKREKDKEYNAKLKNEVQHDYYFVVYFKNDSDKNSFCDKFNLDYDFVSGYNLSKVMKEV
jgi:hypothetical protein